MDTQVYNAAIRGEIYVLEQNREALVDAATPNKNTVLHLSAQLGKTECVKAILSMHPSLLLRQNSSGESPLHLAARDGHADTVKALVEYFISSGGELEIGVGSVKDLLRMRTDEENETALHLAVRYHRGEVVEYLTRQDPEFEHPANKHGETPLYQAASRGYEELVDVMLNNCSSPATGGPDGRSALHGAVISESEGIIGKLLKLNESLVKEADIYGWTALHLGARIGVASIVGQLLLADKSAGYLVDRDDKNTALHIAAAQGHTDVDPSLISFGDVIKELKRRQLNVQELKVVGAKRGWRNVISNNKEEIIKMMEERAEIKKKPKLDFAEIIKKLELEKDEKTKSNIIVATLVATIAFTAAFTVPGGYNEKGMATLARKTAFQAFMISDATALLLSTLAVVVHLLAPDYKGRKRLSSYVLEGTLIVFAIGAMMVALMTGTYVMLAHSSGLAISVCVIGSSFFLIYCYLLMSHFRYKIVSYSGIRFGLDYLFSSS